MRYIIYGAGAIGGSIGARLFQQGHEVVLICRGAHLEKVRAGGLRLLTPAESLTLPVAAAGHPSEIEFRPDDAVLLTMKSQDTVAALEALRDAAGDVPVVCAQNGVANERLALRRFSRVYGMVVILPAVHLEPGLVLMHSSPVGGLLDCGRYPAGSGAFIEQVATDLSGAGFVARADANIMRKKYGKLLNNLGNSIQALCGPEAAAGELARAVRTEALACYEAAGIDYCTPAEMAAMHAPIKMGEIEGYPRSGGSTWQSLMRGASSLETDFLNGEIALLGALHGVPTPYNRMLQSVAAEAVRLGKKPGSYSVEGLMDRARGLGAPA